MDEDRLTSAIGAIYDCATDPQRLAEIGRPVERAMKTESSIHFVSEKRSGRMLHLVSASPNFDAAARRDYGLYYHDRNEWFQRAVHRRPPYVARGEELLDYDDFERTEFCADWCSRVGIYHMIGCVYPLGEGVVGGSGIHHTRRQGAFTDEEKRIYGLLMSHVARALQMACRFGALRQSGSLTLEVIDALDVGVLLVGADRSLLFANRIARKLLRDARWLTLASGRLRPIHQHSLSSFSRRVAVAARTGAGDGLGTGGLLRLGDPLGGRLTVLIAPFRSAMLSLGAAQPTAAVLFQNPFRAGRMRENAIAQAYGLSPAESRLVALLVAGNTLVESAAQAGISLNTAKTQLRAVFAKTGFSRQADLIGDVLANPLVKLAG